MSEEKIEGKMIYDRTNFRGSSGNVVSKEDVSALSEKKEQGPVYDKTDFLGADLVRVDRVPSEIFPNMGQGYDTIKEKEVPRHIVQQLSDSARKGNFTKTLDHFSEFVERYQENLDSSTLEQVRALFKEGREAQETARPVFLRKLTNFVSTLELHPKKRR